MAINSEKTVNVKNSEWLNAKSANKYLSDDKCL